MSETATPPDELFCPSCGYDLRGLTSSHCPECGWMIDREKLARGTIPWVHRAEIGRIKAFVRTAWLASARPAQLAGEASRPVSYHDAQRFRLLVVVLVVTPLCAAALVLRGILGDPLEGILESAAVGQLSQLTGGAPNPTAWQQFICCLMIGGAWWPVPSLALIACVIGITGVASYGFHPAELPVVRQNRAIALSYYAAAPLAFLPVTYLLAILCYLATRSKWGTLSPTVFYMVVVVLVAGTSAAILIGHWIYSTTRMLQVATHCALGRQLAGLAIQCAGSAAIVVMTLALFPAACGVLRVLIRMF